MTIKPIYDYYGWNRDQSVAVEELSYENENEIRELLIGRRVVEVDDERCRLDDGTILQVVPNEGCGGCPSGHYELDELNHVDNAITAVHFDVEHNESPDWSEEMTYHIFVFADARKINFMSVSGDDGNGYYGTGYRIMVKRAR